MIELATALESGECLARLAAAANADEWADPIAPDADQIAVDVAGRRFTLRYIAAGFPPHALRRVFDGEVVEGAGGTRIRGAFSLHRLARLALALWFVSIGLIVGLVVVANLAGVELPAAASGWIGVGVPVAMLLAAAALVRSSLAASRRGEEVALRFLEALLE
ncbi:MAG TPA: hypothetical protein VFV95_16175 [Vicinamibacterales bacterium]|nr:hypothetical protein [Vicinamibacterales bacterium]